MVQAQRKREPIVVDHIERTIALKQAQKKPRDALFSGSVSKIGRQVFNFFLSSYPCFGKLIK